MSQRIEKLPLDLNPGCSQMIYRSIFDLTRKLQDRGGILKFHMEIYKLLAIEQILSQSRK
jgi:hypothetical protein